MTKWIVTCLATACLMIQGIAESLEDRNLCEGKIYETATLNPIWEESHLIDKETLVVFDIDNVVITHTDKILRRPAEAYRVKLRKKYFSEFSQDKIKDLASRAFLKDDWCRLLDNNLPNLMAYMRSKGAKIIALTASYRGPFGLIEDMEEWKIQKLIKLNIDFQGSFDEFPTLRLEDACFTEKFPLFKQGVLFSDPHPKGQVLQSFLNKIGLRPKKVIFIDDSIECVESVESSMNHEKIPFVGFHYTAIIFFPCEVDEEVADFQYRYLVENEVWLGDEEAQKRL